MKKETIILFAEDDDGHADLVTRYLKAAGIENNIFRFKDGEEIMNFLTEASREEGESFVLLLDIRMPKVDGIEVLRRVKQDNTLSKFPVIMVTTTDDPASVKKCHELGCINYVVKPTNYKEFTDTINRLGQFLMTMDVPV